MSRNTIKTFTLLAGPAGLLVFVGQLLGGAGGAVIGLIFGLGLVGSTYFFSDRIAIRAAGATPLVQATAPELHEMVRALSERAGISVPPIYLSPLAREYEADRIGAGLVGSGFEPCFGPSQDRHRCQAETDGDPTRPGLQMCGEPAGWCRQTPGSTLHDSSTHRAACSSPSPPPGRCPMSRLSSRRSESQTTSSANHRRGATP